LSAFIESVSLDPALYVINRTSIKNARQSVREKNAENVRSDFLNLNVDFAIVHWDGKILSDFGGHGKVDRLPIIVTGPNFEQLLGVPQIPSGTGLEMSSAIFDTLEKWSLLDKVQGFVFDTTSSNTGRFNGACALLEQRLERDVLHLACRHHIFELILQAAIVESKLHISSGPDIAVFKRFKNAWNGIDTKNIFVWSSNEMLKNILSPVRQEMLSFCLEMLTVKQPRDDYEEFLKLVIITLGETPPGGIIIRKPGACHQARWMAKAIYCLKIFLLRLEFKLTKTEENAICRVCAFIIKIYIKSWFTATNVSEAPLNDIDLIRRLFEYSIDDEHIATSCLTKFLNHLWYLSNECMAFSIFDERISIENRRLIAVKLKGYENTNQPCEELVEEENVQYKLVLKIENVTDFLTKKFPEYLLHRQSLKLFKRLGINLSFLEIDPTEWKNNTNYKFGKKVVDALHIVNDTAERGVKLMEEFNEKFTKNEEQKQCLLQVSILNKTFLKYKKIKNIIFFFFLYCF